MNLYQQRGFSLLEVMVAVVVFSVGLIGLGLLLTSSIRANHAGFLHSQATFVAESIADSMRANVIGVWQNAYNGVWDAATPAAPMDCVAAACTPAQLAARDVAAWGRMVGQLLPAGSGDETDPAVRSRYLSSSGSTRIAASSRLLDAERSRTFGRVTRARMRSRA